MRVEVIDQRAVHEEDRHMVSTRQGGTTGRAGRESIRTMGCTRTWFLGAIASEWSVHRWRDESERGARRRCNERERGGKEALGCRDSGSIAGSEELVYTENVHVGVQRQQRRLLAVGLLSRWKLSPTSYCDLGKGLSTLAILGRKLLFADPGLQLSTRSKTSLQIRSFRSTRTLQCLFWSIFYNNRYSLRIHPFWAQKTERLRDRAWSEQIRRPCPGLSSARLGVLDESSPLEGVEGREEPTDDEASSSLSTKCCFMSVASLIIVMSGICGPRLGQKRTRDHRTLPRRER